MPREASPTLQQADACTVWLASHYPFPLCLRTGGGVPCQEKTPRFGGRGFIAELTDSSKSYIWELENKNPPVWHYLRGGLSDETPPTPCWGGRIRTSAFRIRPELSRPNFP
jgi:hypothetical protein